MTTFTGTIHKQSWQSFTEIALPMLVAPGFREEDFRRLKDAQRNSLVVDLMSNNEEEFAKERLQTTVFAGTRYGHPVAGNPQRASTRSRSTMSGNSGGPPTRRERCALAWRRHRRKR